MLWRTYAECMTCDRSVHPDATSCRHCGASFQPTPIPSAQTDDD